ncbi:MAG: IS110 family transposase [Gammaproteobacteria bacterium]
MASGIDVGSTAHFVAVPEGCDEINVREFSSFTSDLYALADWLKQCKIETIAMESTGVFWIPLFELLESKGFDVKLVDARNVKNVSGRKTDVLDCQWLQQLHTYGLLNGAFRPEELVCSLRVYIRQKSMLTKKAASHIQHMQKALSQMNLQLHNVIRDITGDTGMSIIREILAGQRDPKILAQHRDPRCKNPIEIIEKSLCGNYKEEHIFSLKQAVELYDFYCNKMSACDVEIEKILFKFEPKKEISEDHLKNHDLQKQSNSKNAPLFNVQAHLERITGIDLTEIPGINTITALIIISEIGIDMGRWKDSKHFASWLGLCPGNKVSGGKRLGGAPSKKTSNRAAAALRTAANSLYRSTSSLGAFLRRLKSRLGPMKAITATAHKIAVIIYNMLKNGVGYIETGADYYEQQYKDRTIKNLKKRAKSLGFELIAVAT